MCKILFLESVAGVAGDMFAASFVDAGLVTIEELNALPAQLDLQGVFVQSSSVIKATMRATHLDVRWHGEEWKQVLARAGKHAHAHHSHEHHTHEHHSHEHHIQAHHTQEHLIHEHHTHEHEDAHPHLRADEDKSAAAETPPHALDTHIRFDARSHQQHWHTHYCDVDRLIEESKLNLEVKELARAIFRHLAAAEAEAHGMKIEEVAFHEVGTVDSILDVVMAAYCVVKVGAERIFATPIKPGRGSVKMQHGTHPIPPPASARLLRGLPVSKTPDAITRDNIELSTPTGIAIIKTLNPQFVDELPEGVVKSQGMGAGTLDLGAYPNVFRLTLLESGSEAKSLPFEKDQVFEIVCNIDDDTSERIAWIAERLLEKGALDVWLTPIYAKKGRPAVTLSVLAEEKSWMALTDWILRRSTTFGVRHRKWDRLKLARRFEKRNSPNGEVTYKIGTTTSGEFVKKKIEFEDLRRALED
jgi:uncharacterized protein (TIGR00299 family) protein